MSRFESVRTTEHEYFEEQLSAYLDGELAPAEHEAVKHHLTTCTTCRWELETLEQTIRWTRELPTVTVPRVFTIPVPAAPERSPRRRWNFLPVLQGATALIAVLLVFAVAGDLMLGRLRVGGAPAAMMQEETAPITVEITREVAVGAPAPVAVEAPAAEPEAELPVEMTVVETVVVESEMVVAPTEAPLAQAVPPSEPFVSAEAPAPAATPLPPSEEAALPSTPEEVSEGAASKEAANAADAATTEAEAAPRLAEETGIGGGEAALTLAAPALPLSATVPNTASVARDLAAAEDAAAEQDQTEARAGEARVDWLRVVEYSLAGVLALLAAATLFLTIRRRRAR